MIEKILGSDDYKKLIKGNRTPHERTKAQLEFVIAYDIQLNNKLTLLDIIKQKGFGVIPFNQLPIEKKAEITIDRINAQYRYEYYAKRYTDQGLEERMLDKDKAVNEIKEMTDLGKALIELEELTILLFLINFKRRYQTINDFYKEFPEYKTDSLLDYSFNLI